MSMNKYVVAHFDLHEGKLNQKIVLANSILEATQKHARALGFTIADNEAPNAILEDHWFTAIKVGSASGLNPSPNGR